MNLFQYILLPFGLSLEYKTLDNVFSGISFSVFSIYLLTTLMSIPLDLSMDGLILKTSVLFVFLQLFRSYILLRRERENFFGQLDAVLRFERNKCPKERLKFGFSMISFISCLMLTYVSCVYIMLMNGEVNRLFSNHQVNILLYQHFALTGLYVVCWLFVIQFINFELRHKYYNVLKLSHDFIERYLSFRPNFLIRYQIDEVIDNFKKNIKQFNKTVDPLNRIIIEMMVILNIETYLLISQMKGSDQVQLSSHFIYFPLTVLNIYFISTQIVIHIKSQIQSILIQKINIWKNSDQTDKYLIVT